MPERISTGRAAEGARPKLYRFQVRQDGMVVASGSGTDPVAVQREAVHYARMYGQDGPVKVRLFGFGVRQAAEGERATRLGKNQRDLLAALGGVTMTLVSGDKVSDSLVRRGLLAAEPSGHMAHITPQGLRALAAELEAGRVLSGAERLKRDRAAESAGDG